MKLLLAVLWLVAELEPAVAQTALPAPEWPRHPGSGRVEFVGTLPWPATAVTPTQRQALARRWFAARLTQMPAAQYPKAPKTNPPYAGLPQEAYLDSVRYSPGPNPEKFTYRLFYDVVLVATRAGLTYRLNHFEVGEIGPHSGTSNTLEALLPKFAGPLRGYERRLRQALAGW